MAIAILSSIIRLTDRLATPIWRVPSGPSEERPSIREDLARLQRMLPRIKAVLNDAEEREIRDDSVKLWLTELKYLAYDAEDVLGEFEYELLRAKVESGRDQTRHGKHGKDNIDEVFDPIASLLTTNLPFLNRITLEIKKIRERFEEIAQARDALHLREGDGNSWYGIITERPPSSPFVDETAVFGREEDKNNLGEILLSDDCMQRNLTIIPIVGMGGLGKTTLAQLLFNEGRICEHFEQRGWVYVSQDFEVVRLTRSIIESLSGKACNLSELGALQKKLVQQVKGKRFLLVLDDMWSKQRSHWETLRIPLTFGSVGSVIIVTTRDETVAKITQTEPVPFFYTLKCLSDEDSWSVFQKHAFGSQDPNNFPESVEIGKEIVKKCGGLPLAAKALGALLCSEVDTDRWKDILQSNFWDLDDREHQVLPALKISYHHLPPHLKRCFLFSSLFYKNYHYGKDELVCLWMAHGFIESRGGKRVEAMGIEYFDELSRRSFFLFQCDQYYPLDKFYVMHDLVHDLAQSIAGEEFSRIENEKFGRLLPNVRHLLSARSPGSKAKLEFPSFYEQHSLRTFMFMEAPEYDMFTGAPEYYRFESKNDLNFFEKLSSLFHNLKYLRVLHLSLDRIHELPHSIDNLKHLRYLCLCCASIRYLPESLCKLYNLQRLRLKIGKLKELPDGMENLTNLHHLELVKNDGFLLYTLPSFTGLPIGIGRLTDLQTLQFFWVSRDVRHCGIENLKDLVNLRGDLVIIGLRNVRSVDSAVLANLKDKVYIESLTLQWSGPAKAEIATDESKSIDVGDQIPPAEEDVIERLQPQPNLKKLTIRWYGGVTFPRWMGAPNFTKLEHLKLGDCAKVRLLPPLGQLPFLRDLYIEWMSSVEYVGDEFCGSRSVLPVAFPSLESLTFHVMHKWQEWCGVVEADFPRLRKLVMSRCPVLKTMPLFLSSDLTDLTFPSWMGAPNFTKLEHLKLEDCTKVRLLPPLGQLPFLRGLYIRGMSSVEYVGDEFCGSRSVLPVAFPSLESLEFFDMPNWQEWCGVVEGDFPRLRNLEMCSCPVLKTMPLFLSLSDLKLFECPGLVSIPILPSLQNLWVNKCDGVVTLSFQPSLKTLSIKYCRGLVAIQDLPLLNNLKVSGKFRKEWWWSLGLTKLKVLHINFFEVMEVMGSSIPPRSLPELEDLEISGNEQVESIACNHTPTLRSLSLVYCHRLMSFSPDEQVPASLRKLRVIYCPLLTAWCEKHRDSRLAHVREIDLA